MVCALITRKHKAVAGIETNGVGMSASLQERVYPVRPLQNGHIAGRSQGAVLLYRKHCYSSVIV